MSQINYSPRPCAGKGFAVQYYLFRSTRTEEKEPRYGDDWIVYCRLYGDDPPTGNKRGTHGCGK